MDLIDSREIGTIEGFVIVAYEVFDEDSTPYYADCYTDEDIAAWKNDEWHYVGVIVKAYRQSIPLGEASIWGMDTGYYWGRGDVLEDAEGFTVVDPDGTRRTDYTFAYGYGSDLVSEAIDQAKATLSDLTKV